MSSGGQASRGQSDVIAVVLLVGISLLAITATVLIGASALDQYKGAARSQQAEHAMTNLDSRASVVALGATSNQQADLPNSENGRVRTEPDAGWINVTIVNETTGEVNRTVVNATLGAVIYEEGDTEIAYQGGGAWRKGNDTAVMVSPPEFHYRDTTLTLPIIQVTGASDQTSAGGAATITDAGTTTIDNHSTPFTDATVNVTLHSEYYEAWGAYFEERTEGEAFYDHANETVTLRLVTPTDDMRSVPGPIVSAAGGSDDVELDNGAIVNAYDSSAGETPSNGVGSSKRGGTITVTGTLKLNSGNVRVASDVKAGGAVTFDGSNVRLSQGDVLCAKGNHGCVNDNVGYDPIKNGTIVNTSTSVTHPEPVTDLVSNKLSSLSTHNDNNATANISSDRLDWSRKDGDTLVLENGSYYLSKLDMSNTGNQRLVLDTSGGDIELGIDGDFTLDGTTIIVRGSSGTVRTYADVSEDRGGSGEMDFTGGVVEVHDASGSRTFEAPRFWVYAPAGIDADIDEGSRQSRFTGVIYSPDEVGAHGSVQLTGSVINGAVVGHLDDVDEGSNDAEIHYDEALGNETAVSGATPSAPKITFMHLTVNEIEVDL